MNAVVALVLSIWSLYRPPT